jgi:hypothetical protein
MDIDSSKVTNICFIITLALSLDDNLLPVVILLMCLNLNHASVGGVCNDSMKVELEGSVDFKLSESNKSVHIQHNGAKLD